MALGTFQVTIDGNRLGTGNTETSAKIQVRFASGRQFVIDSDDGTFWFPHVSSEDPVSRSLPYTLELVTDVDTGESTEIGYEITVITRNKSRVKAGPFPAQAAGSVVDLTDLTADFAGTVPEDIAVRAENARDDAETAAAAAIAVGSTNDGIIAGRINAVGSATDVALSAKSAPNVLTCTVAGDGVTDDRATINNFLAAIPNDGKRYTVHFKGGTGLCYISAGVTSGGFPTGVILPRGDIHLSFPPNGGLISDVTNIRLLVLSGMAIANPTNPFLTTAWATAQTVINLASPVAKGATTLTLSTSGHGLVAGDDIFIRTGNLVADSVREPDAELNTVKSVSGATITLLYPTLKPYVQEYITAGAITSSTVVTASLAPFGVSKVTGMLLKNVKVTGRVWSQGGKAPSEAQGITVYQCWGLDLDGADIQGGKFGINSRFSRDVKGSIKVFMWGDSVDSDPAPVAPSTGCAEWNLTIDAAGAAPAKLHLHEGIAKSAIRYVGRYPSGAGKASSANVSVRARSYDLEIDADVEGLYTTTGTMGIKADDDCDVLIKRLRLRNGTPGSAHLNLGVLARVETGAVSLPVAATASHTTGSDPFKQSVVLNAAQLSPITSGGNTPSVDPGSLTVGAGIMFDAANNEYAHGIVDIPKDWVRWAVELVAQVAAVPTVGADTARWQPTVYQTDGTSTAGTQLSQTFTTADPTVATFTTTFTTTGRHRLLLSRLGAAGTDTQPTDVRALLVRAKRIA